MSGETIENGRGVQALYHNIQQMKLRGYGTVPGNAPTVSVSGTDRAVDITAGEVMVAGSKVSVDAQTKDTRTGDAKPRRDVWYVDDTGDLRVAEGDPADPIQAQLDRGESEFELYEPHPPDGTGFTGTVVAEAYIPAGAADFGAAEFLDLTLSSLITANTFDVAEYDVTDFTATNAAFTDAHADAATVDDLDATVESATPLEIGPFELYSDGADLIITHPGNGFTWRFDGNDGSLEPATFDTADLETLDLTDLTTDNFASALELVVPRYDAVADAPDKEGMLIIVPASGSDTAGAYIHDGNGYTLLDESGGVSAGNLSGLTIDTVKDWAGYHLENVGHDGVRVPSVRTLTVEDFEGGVLADHYEQDRSNFTVQSSVVHSGDYALKGECQAGTYPGITSHSGLGAYFQPGDTLTAHTYFTDPSDKHRLRFGPFELRYYVKNGAFILYDPDGAIDQTSNLTPSNHLNEWIKSVFVWELDGTLTVTFYDSNDNELDSVSGVIDADKSASYVSFFLHNPDTASVAYYDDLTLERRTREYATETKKGTTELGNEVTPSGGVHAGPHEAVLSDRTPHAHVRTDDALSGGDDVALVDDVGGADAGLRGQADGQGFAYGVRSVAALGRVARLNANLSWEYATLADVPAWSTADGGGSVWSYSLTGLPRNIEVSHDGSGNNDFGGTEASVLTTRESLGAFRITFRGVDYTANDLLNKFRVGFHVDAPSANTGFNGTGITYEVRSGEHRLMAVNNGNLTTDWSNNPDGWADKKDISIEYDGATATLLVDGAVYAAVNVSISGAFTPIIQVKDADDHAIAETLTVDNVVVEVLN